MCPPFKEVMHNDVEREADELADELPAVVIIGPAPEPVEAIFEDHQRASRINKEPIELTLLPGQKLRVRISYVEGLDKFFVQLEPDKVAHVETTIGALDTLDPPLLQPLPEEYLTAGYHCTARVDGRVYRCIVLEVVDSSNVHLVLPDYGRTVTAPADQIMVLPLPMRVYFYQSQQCIMVQGHNVSVQQLEELQGKDCVVQVEALDGARLVVRLLEPPSPAGSLLPCPVLRTNFGIAYLSHAASLSSLFLQRDSDAGRTAALLDELYQFYEEGPDGAALAEPAVDTVCAAKSADGYWYRGRVVALRDNACEVHYPDYGNDELIPAENLRRLEPRFLTTAALALPVSLGLEAAGDGALAALRQWCAELQPQVSLSSRFADGRWLASLHECGVDLVAGLVRQGLARPLPTEGRIEVHVSHVDSPSQFWPRPGGELLACFTIHVNSPAEFWLQLDNANFDAIDAALAPGEALPQLDEADMSEGCLCAAKFHEDDRWYRAQVVASGPAGTEVLLLDYGYSSISQELRRLPQELVSLPPLARKCALQRPRDVATWPRAAEDHFETVTSEGATLLHAHFVPSGDVSIVELYYGEPQRSLTEELVAICELASVLPESPPDSDDN